MGDRQARRAGARKAQASGLGIDASSPKSHNGAALKKGVRGGRQGRNLDDSQGSGTGSKPLGWADKNLSDFRQNKLSLRTYFVARDRDWFGPLSPDPSPPKPIAIMVLRTAALSARWVRGRGERSIDLIAFAETFYQTRSGESGTMQEVT